MLASAEYREEMLPCALMHISSTNSVDVYLSVSRLKRRVNSNYWMLRFHLIENL